MSMKAKIVIGLTALLLAGTPAMAQDAKPVSLDALLKLVQQGRVQDQKEAKEREQRFQADKARQAQLIVEAKGMRASEEARSERLEDQFDVNEKKIVELQALLNERLGSLKELFGVIQQAAGDARGQFEISLTNIQFPDRGEFLGELAQKMGSTSKLASLEDIERLWFELQREMVESGKVVRFNGKVVTKDGNEVDKSIVRVGLFNVVADGKYLEYVPETGRVVELQRQPQDRFVKTAATLSTATSGLVNFGIDPTRGQLLSLLVGEPSFRERVDQGGLVGYVTIALGAVGLVIAVLRLIWLMIVGMQVAVQRRRPDAPSRLNPLGRVLQVYANNPGADVETLELKLGEAIIKEVPRLNRWNTLLKVIAVVAPLLGLLGTVTGMILTFQAITLFGTGDPKLMAGGISQALVTTVIGLCVAIPMVLLHALVSGRSRRMVQVLEEQSAGLIAERSESRHGGAKAGA